MNALFAVRSFLLPVLFFSAGLLAASSPTAAAQGTDEAPPSLIQHLRQDLQSESAEKRNDALVDIVSLANCADACTVSLRSIDKKKITIEDETGTGGVVELNALVPDLLETYRSGPADGHRLLALSALVTIGNEAALEQLIDEGDGQSEAVNRTTQRSLAAFYLAKYPELLNRTLKTRRLSLDDVRRAKTLRVRQMKKDGEQGS
jgi:hypothetical protein